MFDFEIPDRAESLAQRRLDIFGVHVGEGHMTNPIVRNELSVNRSGRRRQAENAVPNNRIKHLLGPRDMKWLSDASGIPQSSLSDYSRGTTPRVDAALRIAGALGVSVEQVFGGDEISADDLFSIDALDADTLLANQRLAYRPEPANARPRSEPDASVSIPEIDIAFSMGGGLVLDDHAEQRRVDVPRDWLRPIIKGNFDQVFAARGEGDSMDPTLRDGDIVIVDTAQNAINSQDRVWCIGYGDLGMIKRLRARPDGGIEIHSDNASVAPFTAYDGEVQIIGRVVFIGRRM